MSFIHPSLFSCHLRRHAKRTTVSAEDVKLCSRRSASLLDFITAQGEQLRAAKEGGGGAADKAAEEDQDGNQKKIKGRKKN